MWIISLASQKGGVGKTTLTGHLAVAAEAAGAGPVAVIDTDPQGSLADWWNARSSDSPAFARPGLSRMSADLEALREMDMRMVFIDTPPGQSGAVQAAINHADLVVVPTRPSPHDLRAVANTVELVERADKAMVFVINAAAQRARISSDAAVALSQHGTVAPVTVHNRVDFAASMIDGRTVGEIRPGSRSAREIEGLWTYIAERLERLHRRAVFSHRSQTGAPGPAASRQFGRRHSLASVHHG